MTTKFRAAVIACILGLTAAGGATAQAHHNHGAGTDANKLKVTGGDTTLTLNDAAKNALAAAGITVAPKDPATSPSAGTFTFPIAGGKLKADTLFGFVANKGGLKLTKGDTTVKVHRLVVVNGEHGASVWALTGRAFKFSARGHHKFARAAHHGGGRFGKRGRQHFRWRWHVLRVLSLSNVQHSVVDGKQVITADAALTKHAAKLLNRRFGTTTFSDGQAVGTVKVTATTG